MFSPLARFLNNKTDKTIILFRPEWSNLLLPQDKKVSPVGPEGERRKLHVEELHIFYTSPNIIRQIKSKRMRWAGHVARMGEERMCIRF
jgi:hypothetical protein